MLKALVFDFDGLILDTETPEVLAWRGLFARHGQTLPEEIVAHQVGRGAEQIVERPLDLLARLVPGLDVERTEIENRRLRMDAILAQPVLPGVVALLEAAEREGVRRVVASSSYHDWVDGHLARLGLDRFFEATCCADDVTRAKPYPDLYLLALERLGVGSDEAVALEDSPNGARAAVDAGLRVIVCPNPVTAPLDLSHATLRVGSLAEVDLDLCRRLLDAPRLYPGA